MNTVPDIIRLSGGPDAIEAEATLRGAKLTAWAVKKWPQNGIPEKHWEMLMGMCGANIENLYAANQAVRSLNVEATQ